MVTSFVIGMTILFVINIVLLLTIMIINSLNNKPTSGTNVVNLMLSLIFVTWGILAWVSL